MRTSKGFTLIELIIVIMILGILAAVVIPKFQEFRDKQLKEGGQKIEQVYKDKKVGIKDPDLAKRIMKGVVIGSVTSIICFIIIFLIIQHRNRRRLMSRFNRSARHSTGYFFHDEDEFNSQQASIKRAREIEDLIQEAREQTVGVRHVPKNHDNARRVLDKVRESSKGPLSSMWRHIRRAAESVVDILFRENERPPVQK